MKGIQITRKRKNKSLWGQTPRITKSAFQGFVGFHAFLNKWPNQSKSAPATARRVSALVSSRHIPRRWTKEAIWKEKPKCCSANPAVLGYWICLFAVLNCFVCWNGCECLSGGFCTKNMHLQRFSMVFKFIKGIARSRRPKCPEQLLIQIYTTAYIFRNLKPTGSFLRHEVQPSWTICLDLEPQNKGFAFFGRKKKHKKYKNLWKNLKKKKKTMAGRKNT